MRVLVADDSGVIRSVLKRAVAELGCEDCVEAADGQEAIQAIDEQAFDLIVTDWNMPHATGLDVINHARKTGVTCPIVMQTTECEKSAIMKAIAAGVNDYVLKPFTKDEISEKLEKHFPSEENSFV